MSADKKNFNLLGPFIDAFVAAGRPESQEAMFAAEIEEAKKDEIADALKKDIDARIQAQIDSMDALFLDSMNRTLGNYHQNVITNWIMIVFGVILLSLSIYFGLKSDSFNPFSAITATVGIADFIALFFVNPQTRLRKLIGDLIQMRLIFASWVAEVYTEVIQIQIDNYNIDTVRKVQEAISKTTRTAVKDIEDYIGNDSSSRTSDDNKTPGSNGGGNSGGGGDFKPSGSQGGAGGEGSEGKVAEKAKPQDQQSATRRKVLTSEGKPVE